jgi:hypothetical protein
MGRKKRPDTAKINFRAEVTKIEALKAKFGKTLNRMFKEWVNELLKD